VDDLVHGRHDAVRLERAASGKKLAEHAAHAEEIAPAVELASEYLLGRHVVDGAEHYARGGHRVRREVGHAEVRDLRDALIRDEQVGRLDVAVDDPDAVSVTQALEPLKNGRDLGFEGERRTVAHRLEKVAAPEHLHHNVRRAVGVVAKVEDRHDIGVHHAGDGPGLALEALLLLGVIGDLREHDLERHVAVEHGVVGTIHSTHGSLAEELEELVLPDAAGWIAARVTRSELLIFVHP
jgi:hypothetical protein